MLILLWLSIFCKGIYLSIKTTDYTPGHVIIHSLFQYNIKTNYNINNVDNQRTTVDVSNVRYIGV